jgi:predicted RNase H-like HicB family nuclease
MEVLMAEIKETITVTIEHFTGQDEGDDGVPYFVAHSDDLMFTTEGETFEELLANVRECLVLCLQDTDSVAEYNVAPDARVKLTMELPENYAQIA